MFSNISEMSPPSVSTNLKYFQQLGKFFTKTFSAIFFFLLQVQLVIFLYIIFKSSPFVCKIREPSTAPAEVNNFAQDH